MKKKLLVLATIFCTLISWGQINNLPSTESFDAPFTTGIDVEFIPNWTGNDVQASSRIFRDETVFNSAPAAMSVIPTGTFNGDVRISLDLSAYSEVSLELQAKSVLNGTGDRSAILTIDTSIDGGTTWIGSEVAGSFPNETQTDFTTVNYNLPAEANNESNVIVRLSITRSPGGGTTAKLVIDDVLFSESTSSSVLVHYWNFNDNSSEAAITTVSQSLVAGASLNAISGGTSIIDFAGGTGQNFNVENLNARNGDESGTHLRFNDPIGGALQFNLPTTGFEDVVVMFATRRSGQGAGTQLWFYSINGTDYLPFTNIITQNADPVLETLDFTSIAGVNNNPNFSLRVEFEEGAGGTGGNNRFDNFTLDATPTGVLPTLISNPTPHQLSSGDYIFTEWSDESAQGTYPANMMFWTHSTTDPDLNVEFAEDWNCVYNLESRSRVEGHGDEGFSFVNTGNPQFEVVCDGGTGTGDEISNGRLGAAVLALNTTNTENIIVEWTGRTIAQNNRVYAFRMQYRIGDGNGNANDGWQDFDTPVEYTSGATGNSQNFTTPLPQALENQDLVQLRWVYHYISGSGSRAQIALDNITVSQVSNPVVIANPSSLNFSQTLGTPSDEQSITVSGTNLNGDIEINAPENFEISLTSGVDFTSDITLTATSGDVPSTEVFLRLNNTETGISSGNLVVSSIGADDVEVALSGNTIELSISNPTPHLLSAGDYIFTEWSDESPQGTYPANMMFWTHSTTDPDLNVEFVEDWNCVYNLESRSRVEGHGDEGFSFVNTGNPQYEIVCDGGTGTGDEISNGRLGAAVLALNTTNSENIIVEWTGRTIAQNNRVYAFRMQYRIGDGNGNANQGWQDFDTPVEYTSGATGNSQNFTTPLPQALENQDLVQIRWVYHYISGSGSRAQIALDNITVSQGGADPIIIANPGSLQFTQILGTPSEEQILTVSGTNLSDDITIVAPADFELSVTSGDGFTNSITLTESGGNVEPISVYVRFNRDTEGTTTGDILISSLNVATIAIDVEGTTTIALTTNPEPFILNSGAYSFTQWDENNAAGTYPSNMIFWTHATTDPDLETAFIEDWLCLYNLSNRSRISGEGDNGFSFVNTGNSQFTGVCDGSDPNQTEGQTIDNGRSGTAVLALNTLNRTDITVLWTARTIAQNNRVYGLRMQYRIGNGNGNPNINWQDFDTPLEYISGSTGDFEDFAIQLPEECDDQSLVQLRWVYYYISGSGSRAQIALDDILIEGTPLSVDDFDFNNRFSLYPNPTSGIVYFSEISDVTLYDITGKILLTAKNASQINVESLASGIYLIKNEKGQVLRLIKK